ncbi:hypothetical protein POV27_14250 [Aureisphaera galaxeae]|uniref:hypothetical protein n=1 Tax=Aureisphaera galaxeae TaxID=1538023 RepID=UPI00235027B2|nr:hypothetical protein [Aureisphaera galaxeae]MDC8005219.1 hypothetical protein [Aureisphaera galaxeae]
MTVRKLLYVVGGALLLSACSQITHKTITETQYPELGTLGIYKNYALQTISNSKTVVDLEKPLRLVASLQKVEKRKIFTKKDSLPNSKKDSLLVSLEILDKISLVDMLNKDKEMVRYLKGGNDFGVVTEVTLDLPDNQRRSIASAEEVYLVQNKQKTLSIEVRNGNKVSETIEFSQGNIIAYEASHFCWGTSNGYKVRIMDLVEQGRSCGEDQYKSAKRAERKTEIRF